MGSGVVWWVLVGSGVVLLVGVELVLSYWFLVDSGGVWSGPMKSWWTAVGSGAVWCGLAEGLGGFWWGLVSSGEVLVSSAGFWIVLVVSGGFWWVSAGF